MDRTGVFVYLLVWSDATLRDVQWLYVSVLFSLCLCVSWWGLVSKPLFPFESLFPCLSFGFVGSNSDRATKTEMVG